MSITVIAVPRIKGRPLSLSWLCVALLCAQAPWIPLAASAASDPDARGRPETTAPAAAMTEETATRNGRLLHLVHPQDAPKGLALFFPGSQGWDGMAIATADEVADQGYLVVGIDWSEGPVTAPPAPWWNLGATLSRLPRWLQGLWSGQATPEPAAGCWDLAAELADLATWTASRERLPRDSLPILVGAADGAALVYAALLQSAPNSFHAAASLGFCPRWPSSVPACQRRELSASLVQGDRLPPAGQVPSAWFLFDGQADPALRLPEPSCTADEVSAFIHPIGNARLVTDAPRPGAPAAGGDEPAPLASLLQWLDPRIPHQVGMVSAQADTAGLPLNEVRAPAEDPATFAILLSGDGGWAALDRGVSATLAAKGVSTVGWDSLSYYWSARSPAEATQDLIRVLRHYLAAWHKERVILIGYSFGAEVLPFMANGLPPDLRARVDLVALLGLGPTAMFEFHLNDWLDTARGEDALPVLPQLRQLAWTRGLCIYGAEEDDSLCPQLSERGIEVDKVAGDHHFDEDYAGVATLILKAAAAARHPVVED